MKLTAEQIQQIDDYLVKDKIFYEDIRLELTDHIASHFEETLSEHDDFAQSLKAYMNSHQKVKLLTAARAQEKVRDGYYKRFFLRQFVKPKGLLVLSSFIALLYIANSLGPWAEYVCIVFFFFFTMWFMIGLWGLKSPFLQRLKEEVQLYYLLPILIVSQSRRFLEPTDFLIYTELFFYALIFTSLYFIYVTYKKYKTATYA